MSHINLLPEDVWEFDLAILIACAKKSDKPFRGRVQEESKSTPSFDGFKLPGRFCGRGGCIVLSFDGKWNPFLGDSIGYNRTHSYVPKNGLLDRVEAAMQTSGQMKYSQRRSGGRVFIHDCGAFRCPETASCEIELLTWELPTPSYTLQHRSL
jgi:hypothetical protein